MKLENFETAKEIQQKIRNAEREIKKLEEIKTQPILKVEITYYGVNFSDSKVVFKNEVYQERLEIEKQGDFFNILIQNRINDLKTEILLLETEFERL